MKKTYIILAFTIAIIINAICIFHPEMDETGYRIMLAFSSLLTGFGWGVLVSNILAVLKERKSTEC